MGLSGILLRNAASATLIGLVACAYTPEDFHDDVGPAICDCCWTCGRCSDYYSACLQEVSPEPYRWQERLDCDFDPAGARACVRAWRQRDGSAPCTNEDHDWDCDSLPECRDVCTGCDDDTGL